MAGGEKKRVEKNQKVRKRKPSSRGKHGSMRVDDGNALVHSIRYTLTVAGFASVIVAIWWLFYGAFWINAQIRYVPVLGWLSPILVWLAVFSPLEAVVIYAKFFYKDKDKKKKEAWHPGKSAFDATVEASM